MLERPTTRVFGSLDKMACRDDRGVDGKQERGTPEVNLLYTNDRFDNSRSGSRHREMLFQFRDVHAELGWDLRRSH